ncbi:hypothetical protein H4R99_004914 [Coemansia sp. RSA 1722]|nr:hypothetical protein H4R99_004914 [Coemansia sp. RSA 1722]
MSVQQNRGIQVVLSPQDDGSRSPGPDRILSGHVVVSQEVLESVERIEVHYRGVEVVGGTLEDFEDETLDGLQPRKGVRALSKLYFDERLVVWQKNQEQQQQQTDEKVNETELPFSIAFPCANYPTAVKSVCRSAPSQSFEIAYHITGWLVGVNDVIISRASQCLPFVPVLVRPPIVTPQTPVTRTAYDDRGKECLVTRVTLSQSEYLPNDQVVGGVYMEVIKSNRTIRKAECQLRQRVECRMRRTFSPAETAELIAGGSRPNSSQLSPTSDESDVLWCRSIEITPLKPLTLTATGVGLAAAAAAGCTASGPGHQHAGSSAASNSASHTGEHGSGMEVAEKRESSTSRALNTKSIISSNRSCSANFHIDIPMMTHIVPGHFLLFSYELLIDVTVYSLTRGTQKISTRTPLSSSSSQSTTPTSTVGFTLSRQPLFSKALADNHVNDGSFSATATCFPPNILQGSSSLIEGREGSQLRGSRFSVGAFQSSSNSNSNNSSSISVPKECLADVKDSESAKARYSTFNAVAGSTIYRMDSISSAENRDGEHGALPNAVEQLRFKCDLSLAFVPRIFVPSVQDDKPEDTDAVEDSNSINGSSKQVGEAGSKVAANRDSKLDFDSIDGNGCRDAVAETTELTQQPVGENNEPDNERASVDDNGQNMDDSDDGESVSGTAQNTRVVNSGNSSEFDLARAVSAAAERVLNDKQWDRPASYYLANNPEVGAQASGSDAAGANDSNGLELLLPAIDSQLLPKTPNGEQETDGTNGGGDANRDCGNELGDLDVENAINELAPTKRQSGSTRSSLAGSSGMKDFIQGIDFFGAEDNGPELTGMLSADAGKLVFGVSLTSEMILSKQPQEVSENKKKLGAMSAETNIEAAERERIISGATACPSSIIAGNDGQDTRKEAVAVEEQQEQESAKLSPKPSPQQSRIKTVLRRSMSMPGNTTNTSGGSSSNNVYSPGSTVARSAFETGSNTMLVSKHQKMSTDASSARLAGMSPRSVFSAVSSASRIGSGSRVGVLKTIGNRFTSWFSKKQ